MSSLSSEHPARELYTLVHYSKILDRTSLTRLERAGFVKTLDRGRWEDLYRVREIEARISVLSAQALEAREFPLRQWAEKWLSKLVTSRRDARRSRGAELDELRQERDRMSVSPAEAQREPLDAYRPGDDGLHFRVTDDGLRLLADFVFSADALDMERRLARLNEVIERFCGQCPPLGDVRLQCALASLSGRDQASEFGRIEAWLEKQWPSPDRYPFAAELCCNGVDPRKLAPFVELFEKELAELCPGQPERLFAIARTCSEDPRERTVARKLKRLVTILSRLLDLRFSATGGDVPLGARLVYLTDGPHRIVDRIPDYATHVDSEPYQKRLACCLLADNEAYLLEQAEVERDTIFSKPVPPHLGRFRELTAGVAETWEQFCPRADEADICVVAAALALIPGSAEQVVRLYSQTTGALRSRGFGASVEKLAALLVIGDQRRPLGYEMVTICDNLDPRSVYTRKLRGAFSIGELRGSRMNVGDHGASFT